MRIGTATVLVFTMLGACGEPSPNDRLIEQRRELIARSDALEASIRRFGIENPGYSMDQIERLARSPETVARLGMEIVMAERSGRMTAAEVEAARTRLAAVQTAANDMLRLMLLRDELRALNERIAANGEASSGIGSDAERSRIERENRAAEEFERARNARRRSGR